MTLPQEGYAWIRNKYLRDPNTPPNEKIVFLVIASHASTKSNQSDISIDSIASEAGLTPKTVIKMINLIEAKGFMKVIRSLRANSSTARNVYIINNTFEMPEIVAPTEHSWCNDYTAPGCNEYTDTGVTITPHYNNNNKTNTNNTLKHLTLSKDSIKSDKVATTKQGSLFTIPSSTTSLPFMDTKVLGDYLKGKKGKQRATMKLELAKSGKCSWEELTDTDLIYYYVDKHNAIMPQQISLSMPPGVDAQKLGVFRSNYNISAEELYSVIPTILEIYKDEPECQGILNFGSLANARHIMKTLVERARGRKETNFKVKVNDLNITEEQRRNAPQVF